MVIEFEILGKHSGEPMGWPKDWPLPRVGEIVRLENGAPVIVVSVQYFPYGYSEAELAAAKHVPVTLNPFVRIRLASAETLPKSKLGVSSNG